MNMKNPQIFITRGEYYLPITPDGIFVYKNLSPSTKIGNLLHVIYVK
jgi:hypothetical protein